MLRRIKLYGSLAKYIGQRVLYAEVASAAEAVRYLAANWPGVRQHMADRYYKVGVGDEYIDPTGPELHMETGEKTIKLMPVVAGTLNLKGFFKAVAGIVLIAVSFVVAPISPFLSKVAFNVGASLVLGGVADMISPAPDTGPVYGRDTGKDPRKSYSFNNIQNVSRQGVAIPTVYGETIVGSVVVSAGIDAVEKKKK
jgi:predicted phage tail protein|tara:strand:+ start:306 stop:896 length:591 start_codon:yes stop_codon:yes gene_type:complete